MGSYVIALMNVCLFLFVHFDLYAWNIKKTPIMPVGAKAQVLPSLCGLVESISDKKIQ